MREPAAAIGRHLHERDLNPGQCLERLVRGDGGGDAHAGGERDARAAPQSLDRERGIVDGSVRDQKVARVDVVLFDVSPFVPEREPQERRRDARRRDRERDGRGVAREDERRDPEDVARVDGGASDAFFFRLGG